MNFSLSLKICFILLISGSAFSQKKVGQFALYSLKAKKFNLMEYRTEIGNYQKEKKSYQHFHYFDLPFFGQKEVKSKIKEFALNTHLKWKAIKLACPLMRGEVVTLTISGQQLESCRIDLKDLSKDTQESLYDLRILRRKIPLAGVVYLADIPVWGIAKIETNYLNLEVINFKW